MIRITRQTDYGIVLLSRLAAGKPGELANARDLAREFNLPLPMAGKILKLLTKSGFLTSIRGAKGGYALARKPEEISILDVIGVLEGPVAMTECGHDELGNCLQQSLCPVTKNWQLINQAVRGALAHITLADMVHPLRRDFVSEESLIRGGRP